MGIFDGIGDKIGNDLLDAPIVHVNYQRRHRVILLELHTRFLHTLLERLADVVKLMREIDLGRY